jgi:hypothetical protein
LGETDFGLEDGELIGKAAGGVHGGEREGI